MPLSAAKHVVDMIALSVLIGSSSNLQSLILGQIGVLASGLHALEYQKFSHRLI